MASDRRRIEDLEAEIRVLKRQLREREDENEQQHSLVQNIVAQIKMGQNVEHVDQILKQGEYERKSYENQVKQLERENRVLKDRVWELERRGGDDVILQGQITDLREERARLQRTIDQLKFDKERDREANDRDSQELKQQNRHLNEELKRVKRDLDIISQGKNTTYDDMKRERDSSQRMSQHLQEELKRKKREIEALQAQIQRKFKEEKREVDKSTDLLVLEDKVKEMTQELLDSRIENGRLKDELLACKTVQDNGEKEALLKENAIFKKQIELEKSQNQEALEKLNKLGAENNRLLRQTQHFEATHTRSDIEQQLRERIRELEQYKNEEERRRQQQSPVADNQRQITNLQVEITRLNTLCDRYKQEKERIQAERDADNGAPFSPTRQAYKQSFETLQISYKKIQQDYDLLSQDNADCHREIDELKEKNSTLLRESRGERISYQKERADYNEQISVLTIEIKHLNKRIRELESQLEASEKKEFISIKKNVSFSEKVIEIDKEESPNSRPVPAPRRPRSKSESHPPEQGSLTPQDLKDQFDNFQLALDRLKAGNIKLQNQLIDDPILEERPSLEDNS